MAHEIDYFDHFVEIAKGGGSKLAHLQTLEVPLPKAAEDPNALLQPEDKQFRNRRPTSFKERSSRQLQTGLQGIDSPTRQRTHSMPQKNFEDYKAARIRRRMTERSPAPDDYGYKIRNFDLTKSRLHNRGDSIKSRSNVSIHSAGSSGGTSSQRPSISAGSVKSFRSGSHQWTQDNFSSGPISPNQNCSENRPSGAFNRINITITQPTEDEQLSVIAETNDGNMCVTEEYQEYEIYRVLVMGSSGVGKKSLLEQFKTSEDIEPHTEFGEDEDSQEITVSVSVNNEESFIHFMPANTQIPVQNLIRAETYDGFIVVYSIIHRASFIDAQAMLSVIEEHLYKPTVLLVGNKLDLQRKRAVTKNEGRSTAKEFGCKFIETSTFLNYHVDELLVGVLSQVRLGQTKRKKHKAKTGLKAFPNTAKTLLRRVFSLKPKCENLYN